MSSTYIGNPSNITPGTPLSITEPSDGDAATAASVNSPGPFQHTTDQTQYVYEQLQAMMLLNLTDNGAINSMTTTSDVAWSSSLGLWVAVGNGGLLSTSPDGKTWTARTANEGTTGFFSVGWNGSLFVAVGSATSAGSGPAAITTSPDGVTWTARTSNSGNSQALVQVAWDPILALWCAAGSSGGFVVTSPDGTTWTKTVITSATRVSGVASNGAGVFLISGTDGTHNAWTSTSGTTWTAQTIVGLSTTTLGVAYSAPLSAFLVIDNGATAKTALSTSSAGTSWNTAISTAVATAGLSTIGPSLKWIGRSFVANISSTNTTIQYSVTGKIWRGHIIPLLSGGSIVAAGMGANSDTGQFIIGAGSHAYISLLQPSL